MLYSLCRRALFSMQPETAHPTSPWPASTGPRISGFTSSWTHMPDEDPVELMGLRFPNGVGLAAGMDKNGIRVNAFGALGFGHVEVGTITPLAQPGNPKPRCFRVIPAKGIINRMGFNNEGCDKVVGEPPQRRRLPSARRHSRHQHRKERRHAHRERALRL